MGAGQPGNEIWNTNASTGALLACWASGLFFQRRLAEGPIVLISTFMTQADVSPPDGLGSC